MGLLERLMLWQATLIQKAVGLLGTSRLPSNPLRTRLFVLGWVISWFTARLSVAAPVAVVALFFRFQLIAETFNPLAAFLS